MLAASNKEAVPSTRMSPNKVYTKTMVSGKALFTPCGELVAEKVDKADSLGAIHKKPAASDKEAIQSTRRRHLPSTRSSFVKKPPAIHKKPAASAIHKKPAASHKKPSAIDNAIKYAKRKKKAKLEKDAKKRKNVTVRARLAAKKKMKEKDAKRYVKKKKNDKLKANVRKRRNVIARSRQAAKKGVAYTPRSAEFLQVAENARAAQMLAKVMHSYGRSH
jgi:hypothetical protein